MHLPIFRLEKDIQKEAVYVCSRESEGIWRCFMGLGVLIMYLHIYTSETKILQRPGMGKTLCFEVYFMFEIV